MSIAQYKYERKNGCIEEAVQVRFRHLSKYMSVHKYGGWDKTLELAKEIEQKFKESQHIKKPLYRKSVKLPATPNVYVSKNSSDSITLVLCYPDSCGVRKQVTRSLSVNPLNRVLADYKNLVAYHGSKLPPMSKLLIKTLKTINDRYKLEKERGVTLKPILLGHFGDTEYHPDNRLGESD
jgi:hypothetical protein